MLTKESINTTLSEDKQDKPKCGFCSKYQIDVNLKDSSAKASTIFDNWSELTLISSIFAKKNNLPYDESTYSISGVG